MRSLSDEMWEVGLVCCDFIWSFRRVHSFDVNVFTAKTHTQVYRQTFLICRSLFKSLIIDNECELLVHFKGWEILPEVEQIWNGLQGTCANIDAIWAKFVGIRTFVFVLIAARLRCTLLCLRFLLRWRSISSLRTLFHLGNTLALLFYRWLFRVHWCDILNFFQQWVFEDVFHRNLNIFAILSQCLLQSFKSVKVCLSKSILNQSYQRVLCDEPNVVFR